MTSEEIDRFIAGGIQHGTLAKCVYWIASDYKGVDHEEYVTDVFDRALDAAVRAELKRLVPEVCKECGRGERPRRYPGYRWMHDPLISHCPASPLHEALREEPGDGENRD